MTIYQDSKRIVGTNSDRIGTPAVAGGWKELARTTLGSAGDNIDVSSLGDKRYYMVLTNSIASGGSTDVAMRLNTDTGSNYASRRSIDGAVDETRTSDTLGIINHFENETCLGVHYLANVSSKEKLGVGHFGLQGSAGAGNAPRRVENVGKWTNTSNAINAVNLFQNDSGSFDSGSECVVLGWDPADTHTTNFWEELASDEASGSVASLESGTISAKKYLWIQCYIAGTSASTFCETLFNNDTGSNYANRGSQNGGTDFTRTSQSDLNMFESYSNTTGAFLNAFIINNSSNEKLGISHSVREATSGAGNAPERDEVVFKWTNTSSQITDISFTPQSGTINSGSFLKVWGSN